MKKAGVLASTLTWLGPMISWFQSSIYTHYITAAVPCSSMSLWLGGVKMGLGLTGKPRCAWHQCMGGAWVVTVHGGFGYGLNDVFFIQ